MGGFFRPRQDAESENPGTNDTPDVLRRGGRFFCSLFFGPAKKSESLADRREKALHFFEQRRNIKRFRPLTRPSSVHLVDAHALSANGAAGPEGASIVDASRRNRTKEKRLPDTSTARGVTCIAIFRLGILPRSKNAAHPCAAPLGSADIGVSSCQSRAPERPGDSQARFVSRVGAGLKLPC